MAARKAVELAVLKAGWTAGWKDRQLWAFDWALL
jgi:hypothetical protein